jgi:peptide deformylase
LRREAEPIKALNDETRTLIESLQKTLKAQHNPPGVGLAAPQINVSQQMFLAKLSTPSPSETPYHIFINPKFLGRADELVVGPTPKKYTLEGCLSIPAVYGPVPRSPWVRVEYLTLSPDHQELVQRTAEFRDFDARILQHEYDHLHRVLFIDYTLENELPLYQEDPQTKELVELDPLVVEALVLQSHHV